MKQFAKQAVEPANDEDDPGVLPCVTNDLPLKTQRAVEFIEWKGASSWLSVIHLKEMNFTLNKRELRDAIKLRYGCKFSDIPTVCVCGDFFDADHPMICMRGGYALQRHNEILDLEAEILQAVCADVEMEPVLQDVTGEVLPRGANKAPDTRLDIRARGFWTREQSAFFDVRVCHPNARTSPPLVFKPLEACLTNVNVTTVVSLSYWQSRNRRVTLPSSHGLGLECHLPF